MASPTDQIRQFQDRMMSSEPTLRSCHGGCGRTQANAQMRKCAGCKRTLYCSKECQKKAWPFHKIGCGSIDSLTASEPLTSTMLGGPLTGVSSLGSPSSSPASLVRSLQEFTEAHEWAIRSLAKALVLLNGGIEWTQREPRMSFDLILCPSASISGIRERNPARTFCFLSWAFTKAVETIPPTPDAVASQTREEESYNLAVHMWRWHPDFAGVLHVMFVVDGLNMRFGRFIPLFRPAQPPSRMPLLANDRRKETVLRDMVLLSSGSLNAGIPFRPVEASGTEGMMLAVPGQFTQGENASWSWSALFPRWEDYRRGVHRQLDFMFDFLPFRNAPADTVAAFNFL